MRYITARKRALGLGSAKTGTEHHWFMIVSGIALVGLVLAFVLIFGRALGSSHEEVVATFSRPFPAIVALLTIWVGMAHFRKGAQTAIEDYSRGITQKALLILTICVSYSVMAAGLYAVLRIAI
ncbi:succinate dehydrogenase, hydrophobic membrane anchor protein [Rhodovulum euryhalinum]|uniref:Succinate dehydrogenase / fumarate reductase membrane anchor subunit n=1 Tax=Rhodovulum euryhalinum TaxID=35805 RepID=A0A4R2KMS6_9RHOB|nr:succinate dehydrogenase, hydrophobic membrane anchor protein [Rhodovulum euryhalinum]TCO72066.1 succinate dehydrogenase / fumarate reductase membrane anchor subunit [Rhodovulum euryhalinum]